MEDRVILVDEQDIPIGEMEKLEAHLQGKLHRAISVIVINRKSEILLQQRAFHKYHTPGLWSNTCCSHPRPGENTVDAATRRLQEEMGISCKLEKAFDFIYHASFPNGLIEHEFDHVYFGMHDGDPVINTEEAHAFKWMKLQDIQSEMLSHPEQYTIWFRIIMDKLNEKLPELFFNQTKTA